MAKKKIRQYRSGEVTVSYDAARCIHAAECVRGLPAVFDPGRRPWVDAGAAGGAAVAEVVARCPTGALAVTLAGGAGAEAPPATARVEVRRDGPLYLRGELELTRPDGSVARETRAALCRCGRSRNKPFCDGRHVRDGFRDPGDLAPERAAPVDGDLPAGPLALRTRRDGPVVFEGPVEVRAADGAAAIGLLRGAFCRCGASRAKPFCDGSHREVGFEAE